MAEKTVKARIQVKSDTDYNFGNASFPPKDGEPVFYETSKRFKVGDGTTKIGDLPFVTLPLDDNIVDVGALDSDTLYFSNGNVNVGGTVDASAVNTDSLAVTGDAGITGNASIQGKLITDTIYSVESISTDETGLVINYDKDLVFQYSNYAGGGSSYIKMPRGKGTAASSATVAVTSDIPTSLKNPNALTLKDKSGTVITYDGSVARDLSSGVYYATYSTTATNAINDVSGNKITDTYVTNTTFDSYHSVSDKSISAKIYRNMLKGYLPITIDSNDAQTFEGDSFINGRLLEELIEDSQITFADSVANANGLFIGSSLDWLPGGLNINNVTSVRAMFALCFNLYGVDEPTHNKTITDYNGVFCYCHNLIGCSNWDMSGAVDMTEAFYECNHLIETPIGDMSSCTDFTRTFDKCYDLEWINLTNISASIDISDCYKLDSEALVELIGNLATVTSSPTLKLGTTLYNKLTAAQIAVATGKGWVVE